MYPEYIKVRETTFANLFAGLMHYGKTGHSYMAYMLYENLRLNFETNLTETMMQDHDRSSEICSCDFQGIDLQDRNALSSPMILNYTKANFEIKKKKPHIRLRKGEITIRFDKTESNHTLMMSLLAGSRHGVLVSIWANDMTLMIMYLM